MTTTAAQIAMFSNTSDRVDHNRWLGILLDHRRLFDALQDGWLRPSLSRSGLPLGINTYASDTETTSALHPIPVRLRLDATKLPDLEAVVLRDGGWVSCRLGELRSSDEMLCWPGVIPTFAISDIIVGTDEHFARLVGLAKSISNIELSGVSVEPSAGPEEDVQARIPIPRVAPKLVVPDHHDAVHGAMSMALWAIPRIDPWFDLLKASLTLDRARLPGLTTAVDAVWWRFAPWAQPSSACPPLSLQEGLWIAARDIFRDRQTQEPTRSRELARQVAKLASQLVLHQDGDKAFEWFRAVESILRGESTFQFESWRSDPVGLAIQLVLARPEPMRFRTWFADAPQLPPAVAWSAAALCGLLHGYRGLEVRFRGPLLQRELLAIHALSTCSSDASSIVWPTARSGDLQWRRERGEFVLSWGDRDFTTRPEKARGKWFSASLDDAATRREATRVARALRWNCMRREVELVDEHLTLSGSGNACVCSHPNLQLDVQGQLRLQLPAGAVIKESFDVERFRQCVATESGPVPDPPFPHTQMESGPTDVPGLVYARDFLGEREEAELLARLDACDWQTDLQRRVQHYGWRYDYKARRIDPSMKLGPLPDWAAVIASRLVSSGLLPALPDQVIVNEYIENQGITRHVDSVPSFADGIATISLLESWEMVFRRGKQKVGQLLERRSAAVMSGAARYEWTHEIPKRRYEYAPRRTKRQRRVSLTFRKISGFG